MTKKQHQFISPQNCSLVLGGIVCGVLAIGSYILNHNDNSGSPAKSKPTEIKEKYFDLDSYRSIAVKNNAKVGELARTDTLYNFNNDTKTIAQIDNYYLLSQGPYKFVSVETGYEAPADMYLHEELKLETAMGDQAKQSGENSWEKGERPLSKDDEKTILGLPLANNPKDQFTKIVSLITAMRDSDNSAYPFNISPLVASLNSEKISFDNDYIEFDNDSKIVGLLKQYQAKKPITVLGKDVLPKSKWGYKL